MRQFIFACLVAVSLAAPKPQVDTTILRDERVDQGDGNFNYAFELSDGTAVEAVGTPGASGAVTIRGSYTFTLPDGAVVQINYVADEGGFRPLGDVIPTPHPLPAHVFEQIRIAEQQRAQGITFDGGVTSAIVGGVTSAIVGGVSSAIVGGVSSAIVGRFSSSLRPGNAAITGVLHGNGIPYTVFG